MVDASTPGTKLELTVQRSGSSKPLLLTATLGDLARHQAEVQARSSRKSTGFPPPAQSLSPLPPGVLPPGCPFVLPVPPGY